jgi:purine-binding chemotaxis protein CheW
MKRVVHPTTGEIDWPELHARVTKAFDSTQHTLQSSSERSSDLLDERARRLARPAAAAAPAFEAMEVLVFKLGREQYGLETRYAREVLHLADFTAIPGVPDFVIGVTNLRGDIVPVFDLMLFFGFASQGLMDRSRVIAVGKTSADFGIIADTVQEVMRLSVDEFVPNPAFEGRRGQECIRGVTRNAMIVLDGAALISDQRLFIGSPGGVAP